MEGQGVGRKRRKCGRGKEGRKVQWGRQWRKGGRREQEGGEGH
jgi:hypothetical protein